MSNCQDSQIKDIFLYSIASYNNKIGRKKRKEETRTIGTAGLHEEIMESSTWFKEMHLG